jgi:hypothetical protein
LIIGIDNFFLIFILELAIGIDQERYFFNFDQLLQADVIVLVVLEDNHMADEVIDALEVVENVELFYHVLGVHGLPLGEEEAEGLI